ncbi:Trk system potassium transporter TrkA [Paracoccus sp. S-4012]|uniref:Trk system potassium transporter TrkA n=1 Tax=Paracoccus sp. S-4012 TaxID=2665648 RepID=UPI0012B15E9F|nr:Trk system potassium transporter TrkA [Paracoccus sp. S-4012]MRX51536.1 Trk system potassium transporter TrkA [Paracoccus sp. S-4012]
MKVIICGAGRVGWQIGRQLSAEGNDVTLIDIDPELIRRATDALDVKGVAGFASHPDVLDQAGARDCDLLVAVTPSDEVNMVACEVAHAVFEVPRKIARLRSPAYLDAIWQDMYRTDRLPIDHVISPEREVARAALERLAAPAAFDTGSFLDGQAQLYGIVPEAGSAALDTPLRQLTELFPRLRAVVLGLQRQGQLFAPEPDDQILEGDRVYLMAHQDDAARTLELFGRRLRRPRRVILVGGGPVAVALAEMLEQGSPPAQVTIIEPDQGRGEAAADALNRAVVLKGSGLSTDLLSEAGVGGADAVVTITGDDRTNILAAVRAHQMGAPLTVAVINDPTLVPLVDAVPVGAWIEPRGVTVSTILRHVRRGRVRDVQLIADGAAEVIEAQVLPRSGLAGRTIGSVGLPAGALFGLVRRGDEVVAARPTLRLEPGDLVTLLVLTGDLGEVDRLLQVGIDYF